MNKYITTTHYASLPIYSIDTKNMHQENLVMKAIEIMVSTVLDNHTNVQVDEEFRCNALTEVGLISDCIESLQCCVNELIDIINTKKYIKLGG